jgi:hypothetical protein
MVAVAPETITATTLRAKRHLPLVDSQMIAPKIAPSMSGTSSSAECYPRYGHTNWRLTQRGSGQTHVGQRHACYLSNAQSEYR